MLYLQLFCFIEIGEHRVKVLDKYIISSIMKTALIATVVFSLILAGVELFGKMDSILTGGVGFLDVLSYAFLCIPQYFIMVFSISLLFSTTYFQSSLSANNERIALLNAGLSKWRLFKPIFFLAIVLTIFSFLLSESFIKDLDAKRETLSENLFGLSSTQDSRNIVLNSDNGYVVYTNRYTDYDKRIISPIIIKEENGNLLIRISGRSGYYENNHWIIDDANVYRYEDDVITNMYYSSYELDDLNLEPDFFKSNNINVETMDIQRAFEYLKKLKQTDREVWQEKATDYYRSLFKALSVFVLLCITGALDYNLKKNVLLFSIIQSLSIAIVYYVSDMVFSICSHQGAIMPFMAVVLPVITTVFVALIINYIGKKI